ncbi:MAG TPA: cyclic nucleotide-binding domain-containing protein [Kofleriaceae bacterium]|nr:cyclic nucleotide-binding domain-containing protein [Kofleriaceae bacterium]
MARKDVRTLRDEAAEAASAGKHKRALECYLELEQREPSEPNWPKRAAEIYRRLGKQRDAVAAYDRAAERYAQTGFLVQAIAVSKIIQQIDPGHEPTRQRLASIADQQDAGRSQAGALADRHRGIAPIEPRATPRSRPETPSTLPGPPAVPPARAAAPAAIVIEDIEDAGMASLQVERNDALAYGFALPPDTLDVEGTDAGLDEPAVVTAPGPAALDGDDEPTRGGYAPATFDEPSAGTLRLDRGAPLDSVTLAGAIPGAQPERFDDGSSSGIIVIPLDDDLPNTPADSLEIHAVTVEPDGESSGSIPLPPDVEPEELSVEDLEEVLDLAEPRAYSAAARKALAATPLFAGLPGPALEQLIEQLALVEIPAGDTLFRQGDPGDTLYVVVEGEVVVLSEGPPQVEISRLGPGAFFGEIALVTDQPRSATIFVSEDTQLLAIDREVVRALLEQHPDVLRVVLRFLRERLVDGLVQTHPMFQAYGDAERRDLVSRFRFLEIGAGATVLEQGKRAPGLYALLAGTVELRRDGGVVATLGPGDLFGEVSVLTGEPSDVTVVAGPRCLALCLPASDFREIIMTHPHVLSYIGDLVDERRRREVVRTSRVKLV